MGNLLSSFYNNALRLAPFDAERAPIKGLVPIEQLPFELLGYIFLLGVEGQAEFIRQSIIAEPESLKRFWSTLHPHRYRSCTLSITGVCKKWRVIAKSLSALWRFVTVDFGQPLSLNEWDLQRLNIEHSVSLARNTPLEVLFIRWPPLPTLCSSSSMVEGILRLLRPLSGETRWRSMFIHQVSHSPLRISLNALDFKCERITVVNGVTMGYNPGLPAYLLPLISSSSAIEIYGAPSHFMEQLYGMVASSIRSLDIVFASGVEFDGLSTVVPILLAYQQLESLRLRTQTANDMPCVFSMEGVSAMEFSTIKSLDYCIRDLRNWLLYPLTVASDVSITFPSLTHLSLSSSFPPLTDAELEVCAFTPPSTVTHLTLYANYTGFGWAARELILQNLFPHSINTLELKGNSEKNPTIANLLQILHHPRFSQEHRPIFPGMQTLTLNGVVFETTDIAAFIMKQPTTQWNERDGIEGRVVEVWIHACNEDRPKASIYNTI